MKSLRGRDYGKHEWSRMELVVEGGKCVAVVAGLSWYFYRSFWAMLPLSLVGVWHFKRDAGKKAECDRRRLLLQFRDMIRSVAAAMGAGYGVENAFLESYEDMRMMHGQNAMICQELELIRRGMVMSLTPEELLKDLGERSRTEHIREFAAVFAIVRKNGGSMTEMIRFFADLIHRQVEVREEILVQTSGRRMEQNIMNIMPFVILAYVGCSNRGYFDMLYHNVAGVIIMSICLAVYLAACRLSDRILEKAVNIWE